jgi:hypothetical protein
MEETVTYEEDARRDRRDDWYYEEARPPKPAPTGSYGWCGRCHTYHTLERGCDD